MLFRTTPSRRSLNSQLIICGSAESAWFMAVLFYLYLDYAPCLQLARPQLQTASDSQLQWFWVTTVVSSITALGFNDFNNSKWAPTYLQQQKWCFVSTLSFNTWQLCKYTHVLELMGSASQRQSNQSEHLQLCNGSVRLCSSTVVLWAEGCQHVRHLTAVCQHATMC